MVALRSAVDVTVDLLVDWAELGRVFAELAADEQADFFMAFHESVANMQIPFIGADKIFDGNRMDAAETFEHLAHHIRHSSSR